MTKTPTYGLIKPAGNEYYDVEVFNQNADIIDEALSQKATLDENGRLKREQTPDAAGIPCEGYDSIADAVNKLSDAVEAGNEEIADSIEKIVDGTTKAGDAAKLNGQEASYYAAKSSVDAITDSKGEADGIATLDANKKLVQMPTAKDVGALPLTGGTITGDLTVNKEVPSLTFKYNNNLKAEVKKHAGADYDYGTKIDDYNGGVSDVLIFQRTASLEKKLRMDVRNSDGTKTESYNFYHTGSPPSFTDVGGVNPNLLHNWYFLNPVNRKGLTSYSGKGITVDCWNNNYPAGTVTLDDGGLTLGEMKWLIQDIKRDLNGEKLTASMLTSDGNLLKGTLTYTGTRETIIEDKKYNIQVDFDGTQTSTTTTIFQVQIGPSEVSGCTEYRIVNYSSSDPITIVAVKLEIGAVQTLAHKDSSGKWVLNEIPDYAEQMAICGQYDDNGNYVGAANAFAPIKEKTASCTLSAADAGGFVSVNSASDVTVTVPADADVGFAVGTELEICRMGAGNVTIAGADGVTVNSIGGELSIAEQFGCAALKKTAADVWLLSGNLG